MLLTQLATAVGELVAPARCMVCLQEDTWLCRECAQALPSLPLRCIGCYRVSPGGITCRVCRPTTRLFGVVSAGVYSQPALQRGIHWLKFKHVRAVAAPLASLLAARLTAIAPREELAERAVLVPIPLHKRREDMRGFNQSLKLAAALSTFTGIPVLECLERARATWTQTKLPAELRMENLTEAFRQILPVPVNRHYVLLIDDVTTTGSTLSAAAELFPWDVQIWGVTVARG